MDMEWAIDHKDRIWILQARPETVWSRKNKEKKDIKAMDIKLQNRAGRGTVVMVTDLDDEVVEANF
jgi:phosphoenolpyruvate synthase/pyruvate phosphate dikinase